MTPGSCKNTSKCKEIELWVVKIMFYAIFSEIWDLGGRYCTNLEYKLVLLIQKTNWNYLRMSTILDFYTLKLQKYVKMQVNWALRGSKSCFMLFFPKIWYLDIVANNPGLTRTVRFKNHWNSLNFAFFAI